MKEKLPGLFRPLMKFNVTAVMVIILMFSVFNVFSIVRTQQRQASLQTMALSQASQQIGDFIASAEQLGIVVQNDSQLMAYNLYNNRDLPHNIVWELEMLAPSVNSLSSLSIVYVDSLYPQINGVIYSSAGRFSSVVFTNISDAGPGSATGSSKNSSIRLCSDTLYSSSILLSRP